MTKSTISAVMAELGRRGGKVSSDAKAAASRKSLAKARAKRWPGKAGKRRVPLTTHNTDDV